MEGEGIAQRGRNLQRHAGGILRDALDGGDFQGMEVKHARIIAQMHLKYSKGSRQARQRCSALHGVEPNSLMHSVSVEWQRGQATGRLPRNTPAGTRRIARGGTMP